MAAIEEGVMMNNAYQCNGVISKTMIMAISIISKKAKLVASNDNTIICDVISVVTNVWRKSIININNQYCIDVTMAWRK